jgi:tetratricopeptide (TPR) repeat protein
MKDELTKMLKIFKDGFPGDDLKYIMGDYARMFLDRDHKKEGMEIYLYVSKLYPDEAGLLSDIAATYFKLGEVCQATNYLELCINASNKDDMVYNNYSFINFVMGDYEKSIAGVKNVKNAGNLWELYQGLYYYYLDNPQWYSKLSNFICNNTIKDGVELAKFLISKENLNDYNSFIKSKDKDKGIYNLLLYKRAIKKFPEEYQPYFLYAERMTYYKNYEEAIKIFNLAEGKNIFLNNEEKSLQNYYYGWALQDSGKLYEASKKWLNLLDSVNFQYKSAACYFYGKYLMNSGRNEEAIKIFEKVSDDANKSKFATYCWNLLSTLKNWK